MGARQSPTVLAREILSQVNQGNNRYLNNLRTTSFVFVVLFQNEKETTKNLLLYIITWSSFSKMVVSFGFCRDHFDTVWTKVEKASSASSFFF